MAAQAGLSPLGKAFFGSLCAGTFGLGCWQTQRYFEKIELEAERERDLSLDPLAFQDAANDEGSLRPRIAQGSFRHEQEVLVGPRGPPPGTMEPTGPFCQRSQGSMSSGPQGYYVITPLETSSSSGNTTILVNRGWIPRHFVAKDTPRRQQKQQRGQEQPSLSWERPSGPVKVIGVPTRPEQPRMITPVHDLKKRPVQLYWMDQQTLQQLAGIGSNAPLWTQVKEDKDEQETFPVKPPMDRVGEYKTTPAIHAGYAATWFGLAGAGMVMTRKLLTRGRY